MPRGSSHNVPSNGRGKNKTGSKGNVSNSLESKLSKVREVKGFKTDKFVEDIVDAGYVNESSILLWPPEQFESCVVGADTNGCVVYSAELIIKSFMKDGMSYEEAEEFFDYNTLRAIEHIPHAERPIILRVQRKRATRG